MTRDCLEVDVREFLRTHVVIGWAAADVCRDPADDRLE
jgi:hypothetical protein